MGGGLAENELYGARDAFAFGELDAQHALGFDRAAVLPGRLPARGVGHGFQHASFEAVVGRFELLVDDGVALGGDFVAQDHAGGGFARIPPHRLAI